MWLHKIGHFSLLCVGGIYELRQNKAYCAALQVFMSSDKNKQLSKSCAISLMTNLQGTIETIFKVDNHNQILVQNIFHPEQTLSIEQF